MMLFRVLTSSIEFTPSYSVEFIRKDRTSYHGVIVSRNSDENKAREFVDRIDPRTLMSTGEDYGVYVLPIKVLPDDRRVYFCLDCNFTRIERPRALDTTLTHWREPIAIKRT
ncbi:MAG: hypothetical protein VB093_01895 [Propionicimonas sp.]|nr:hypothetical protein [Propionicimonas sp.]